MAVRGRPPKPTEVKRRMGNPGKRKLPEPGNVIALPAAEGVPEFPATLEEDGRLLWSQIWRMAAIWLSPVTDAVMVQMACELADGRVVARNRYLATHEPPDLRAWITVNNELRATLSALGFDPTARARLGVAEVKAASVLDELRARQRRRDSKGS